MLRNAMLRNPTITLHLGCLFLVLSNVVLYFVRDDRYPSDLGDGAAGLLMGIAIGLLGLSIWTKQRGLKDAA